MAADKADKEAERSVQIFRTVFEQAAIGIGIVRLDDARWIDVNAAFCRMLGYSVEDFRAKPWPEITHPDDVDLDWVPFRELAAGERESYTVEKRFIHKAGHPVSARLTLSLVRDRDGRPDYEIAVIEDISQRKRAELELARSRERLALAVNYAHVGFFDWDLRTDHLVFSEQMLKDWGVRPEQYGRTLEAAMHLVHPEDQARVREVIERAIHERRSYDVEFRVLRPDGQVAWLEAHGVVMCETEGAPSRVFGTFFDVTERRAAADALQVSLQRLRATFDSAGVGLVETEGADDVIINANDRLVEILGYRKEELFGKTVHEITAPEDRAVSAENNRAIQRGLRSRLAYEKRYVRKDGEPVWVNITLTGLCDAEGRHWRTISTVEDISGRKKAEEALRASEQRFRTYAEAMPQMAFIADADGNITYYNQRMFEYTGHEIGGGWGWKESDLIHPEDLQRTIDTWTSSLRTGTAYELELRLRRHDGEYRWHLARAVSIRDGEGRIVEWLGTNTDIHEQKELVLRLERAVRARDEFLSIASHELKTPLSSLRLQAQILKRSIARKHPDAYSPENVNRMVELTDRQVSRLARLVDDMLDVGRIESGKLRIQPEPGCFCEIVHEVVERLRPEMTAQGCEPQLDCGEPIEGVWDRFRIEQVVMNLLTNGLRYGSGRPIFLQVRRVGEERLRLTVRDQGIGISPEDQERIFHRFERAVGSSEISGLGLGLFISREIVQRHGGRLWVESEPGKGAAFHVELPLRSDRWREEMERSA